MITLYSYQRSSAAYRTRIVLELKGIPHKLININLMEEEEQDETYFKINPQKLIPSLVTEKGEIITQSTSIIEYLEEKYTQVPLLPEALTDRAIIRAMTNAVACDIHPLDNMRVLKYIVDEFGVSEEQKMTWYQHWILEGFKALEIQFLKHSKGQYCFGNSPTMAETFLIPQVYNAHRFKVNISEFPLINQIYDHCCTLEAFIKASPENQ